MKVAPTKKEGTMSSSPHSALKPFSSSFSNEILLGRNWASPSGRRFVIRLYTSLENKDDFARSQIRTGLRLLVPTVLIWSAPRERE